jgi:hypothetical protein
MGNWSTVFATRRREADSGRGHGRAGVDRLLTGDNAKRAVLSAAGGKRRRSWSTGTKPSHGAGCGGDLTVASECGWWRRWCCSAGCVRILKCLRGDAGPIWFGE